MLYLKSCPEFVQTPMYFYPKQPPNLICSFFEQCEIYIVCLFEIFTSQSRIFTHLEISSLLARDANFDLFSALMTVEQWGFYIVLHILWHGSSVYNGHLRGPVTLSLIAERLAVELSLPVFTTFRLRGERSNPLFHRHG